MFSASFLLEVESFTNRWSSSTDHQNSCQGHQDMHAVLTELWRWTSKQSPAASNELGSTPSIIPAHQEQQIQVGCLPYASNSSSGEWYTSSLERSSACGVFDFCLSTSNILLYRRICAFCASKELTALWHLCIPFPSCDNGLSMNHVRVETAEFLKNFLSDAPDLLVVYRV